jgi:hypothetical protein
MVLVSLIAGIGLLLAGILAIVAGIPVKEFSFGNTLILVGTVTACSGIVMIGLWTVARELREIARRLGGGLPSASRATTAPSPAALGATASTALSATLGDQAPEDGGFLFSRDQPATDAIPAGSAPPPWHEEAASRDRGRSDAPAAPVVPEPAEAAPAVKPKRNLLFSSSSRRERERAQARTADAPVAEPVPATVPATAPLAAESREPPPATFDDAWPKPERSRSPDPAARRSGRAPSTFAEANTEPASADRPPPPRTEDPPAVTVLKSGVVDGMAYSLYSDGSIEAQMPEGMMRFASIDELRAHLDHRP